MNTVDISIIVTSYNEPILIRQAIKALENNLKNIPLKKEVIIIAPDKQTIESASNLISELNLPYYKVITDQLRGKPAALNIAINESKGVNIILTDGDVQLEENSIYYLLKELATEKQAVAVSGNPTSADARDNMWGFFSHLYCSAADYIRNIAPMSVQMSGYLYAVKGSFLRSITPIPEEIRAEDGYVSKKILEAGKKYTYANNAIVNVMFPKNRKDWLSQKTRSVGGAKQLTEYFSGNKENLKHRSFTEDIKFLFYPIRFATTLKEYTYLPYLYVLRLWLWIIIFYKFNFSGFSEGAWKRIESSKY